MTISLMNFCAALIRLFLFSSTFWPFSSLVLKKQNKTKWNQITQQAVRLHVQYYLVTNLVGSTSNEIRSLYIGAMSGANSV